LTTRWTRKASQSHPALFAKTPTATADTFLRQA